MTDKPEVYGVVWRDKALGWLTLPKPNAAAAIATATDMIYRGAGKIEHCRAVHAAENSDTIVYLTPLRGDPR